MCLLSDEDIFIAIFFSAAFAKHMSEFGGPYPTEGILLWRWKNIINDSLNFIHQIGQTWPDKLHANVSLSWSSISSDKQNDKDYVS